MLAKAVVLILIGSTSPAQNPQAVQAGSYPTADECRSAGTAFMAAAMASGKRMAAICVETPFPFTGKDA